MTSYYRDHFAGTNTVVEAKPSLRERLSDRRLVVPFVVAVGFAIFASAAVEYSVMRPQVDAALEVSQRADLLAIENQKNEATLGDYEQFLERKRVTDARYDEAVMAIPTEAELPNILASLEDLSKSTGATLVSYTPANPEKNKAQKTTPPSMLGTRAVTVVIRGDYQHVQNLLQALGAYSRILTVERLSAREASDVGARCEATIDLTCYFKQAQNAALPQPGAPNAKTTVQPH